MLNSINLNDKSYEELLLEAVAQIPLYSREWTNFNASDPGITILENLTAFQQLQQEEINEVPEEIRRKLLRLVGYEAHENSPAVVLAQAPAKGGPVLPLGHQLWSGDMSFETTDEVELNPWGLAAVYAVTGSERRDITYLISSRTESVAYPFGRRPEVGAELVCILTGIPELGRPVRLWLEIAEEELRNPFQEGETLPIDTKVRWQYFTENGWQDARAEDETCGLLRPGMVTLYLEGDNPAELTTLPVRGCALRCVLERSDYDRAPRLRTLAVHLFPLRQQQTRVQCLQFSGSSRIKLQGRLAELGFLEVYCREEENGPFRAYREAAEPEQQGRFYRAEQTPQGTILLFDPDFGYAPYRGPDAIRVICLDEEMIYHRDLGMVYGYEDQVLPLEQLQNVVPDHFLALMEVEEPLGDPAYWFVSPGETDPDRLCYRLNSRDGELRIVHPGLGRCHLYLAHCAVTKGAQGNLRAFSTLEQRGGYDGTEVEETFLCPAPGRGGVTYESVEELRHRFASQLRSIAVAVCAEDYERLVLKTPGLCIHKVKAFAVGKRNLVRIVVKPYTDQAKPKLSADYLRQIRDYLEPRRMLTTRIELVQPNYVPVAVSATLTVSNADPETEAEIKALLCRVLDHINGEESFGSGVRFHRIYQLLNGLPYVEAVETLSLLPEHRGGTLVGSDVKLDEQSLCCPGTIHLTLRQRGR